MPSASGKDALKFAKIASLAMLVFPSCFIVDTIAYFALEYVFDHTSWLTWVPLCLFVIIQLVAAYYYINFFRLHSASSGKPDLSFNGMIESYQDRTNSNRLGARAYLTFASFFALAGPILIGYRIVQYFQSAELSGLIAITDDITLNSILYQCFPYVAFLVITYSLATILFKTYRRLDDLACYYSSRVSSLKFFYQFFKAECDTQNFEAITPGSFKEKMILDSADTHKPEYLFRYVLNKDTIKFDKEQSLVFEKLINAIGEKSVGLVNKAISNRANDNHVSATTSSSSSCRRTGGDRRKTVR